jgi:hypothetical protein
MELSLWIGGSGSPNHGIILSQFKMIPSLTTFFSVSKITGTSGISLLQRTNKLQRYFFLFIRTSDEKEKDLQPG